MHAEDLSSDARMSAYLDGALSPDESAAFEAQLQGNPAEREELDGMRKLLGVLGNLPEPEAPEDFYEQVRRRLRRSHNKPEELLNHLVAVPFQVLSIVVILAAAAIFLMSELDRDQQKLEREGPETPAAVTPTGTDSPAAAPGDPKGR